MIVRRLITLDSVAVAQPVAFVRGLGRDSVLIVSGGPPTHVQVAAGNERLSRMALPTQVFAITDAGASSSGMWIFDGGARRVLVWRRRSQTWGEQEVPSVQPREYLSVLGMLNNDATVFASQSLDVGHETTSLLLVAAEGRARVLDSLRTIGGEIRLPMLGGGSVIIQQPWAFSDHAVVGRDDGVLTVLKQDQPRPDDEESTVVVYRYGQAREAPETTTRRIRLNRVDESAVRAWVQLVLRDTLASVLGGHVTAEAALRAALFRPAAIPVIRRVVAGTRGSLYVERVVPLDSAHHWEVWDADGRTRGEFTLPPNAILQDASGSKIWALVRHRGSADSVLVGTVAGGR